MMDRENQSLFSISISFSILHAVRSMKNGDLYAVLQERISVPYLYNPIVLSLPSPLSIHLKKVGS